MSMTVHEPAAPITRAERLLSMRFALEIDEAEHPRRRAALEECWRTGRAVDNMMQLYNRGREQIPWVKRIAACLQSVDFVQNWKRLWACLKMYRAMNLDELRAAQDASLPAAGVLSMIRDGYLPQGYNEFIKQAKAVRATRRNSWYKQAELLNREEVAAWRELAEANGWEVPEPRGGE